MMKTKASSSELAFVFVAFDIGIERLVVVTDKNVTTIIIT